MAAIVHAQLIVVFAAAKTVIIRITMLVIGTSAIKAEDFTCAYTGQAAAVQWRGYVRMVLVERVGHVYGLA